MNRGFFSMDPDDPDGLLSGLFGRGGSSAGNLQEELIKAYGLEEELQQMAKREVDAGATDCDCGKSDCPRGKAIRAEVERRKSGDDKSHEQNQVVADYMLLQRQLTDDIAKAVETGVANGGLEAIQRFFSEEPEGGEDAQKRLAAIFAAGLEAAVTHMWHGSPIYKYVWLPVKLIFVVLAILVTTVLTPVIHLVVAIPGFFYAAFRRESIRKMGIELIKRKLIKQTEDYPELLRITREDLRRYGSDRLQKNALKLLPFYLRWGAQTGDYFATWPGRWDWFRYSWRFRFASWREDRVFSFNEWWQKTRFGSWYNDQRSRWQQSHHPVDTSVATETGDPSKTWREAYNNDDDPDGLGWPDDF